MLFVTTRYNKAFLRVNQSHYCSNNSKHCEAILVHHSPFHLRMVTNIVLRIWRSAFRKTQETILAFPASDGDTRSVGGADVYFLKKHPLEVVLIHRVHNLFPENNSFKLSKDFMLIKNAILRVTRRQTNINEFDCRKQRFLTTNLYRLCAFLHIFHDDCVNKPLNSLTLSGRVWEFLFPGI